MNFENKIRKKEAEQRTVNYEDLDHMVALNGSRATLATIQRFLRFANHNTANKLVEDLFEAGLTINQIQGRRLDLSV